MAIEIGIIQTVVGTGEGGYAGDGGPAIQALIGEAYGCAFDTAGNLYISDGRTHTVRRIYKIPDHYDRRRRRSSGYPATAARRRQRLDNL